MSIGPTSHSVDRLSPSIAESEQLLEELLLLLTRHSLWVLDETFY
jgi:hypothetical protein